MKPLRTLLVLSSALIVQNYSAQQETQPSQGKVIVPKMMNGNSQTYKVNPNAPQRKTTASKFASKEEEITYLKRYKSSIETKRAYLESNPQRRCNCKERRLV